MQDLINEVNKARVELLKQENLLLSFCRNTYYELEWRFKVWEEVAKKIDYNYGLDFKHGTQFDHAVPICIRGYDGFSGQPGDSTTYEDLIAYVADYQLENIPEHELTDAVIDASFQSPNIQELKEWLMLENLGSWR